MISITKCKQILNKNGVTYSNEEIELIRGVLYKLAEACKLQNKITINQKNKKE
jgi:hypothetical protein